MRISEASLANRIQEMQDRFSDTENTIEDCIPQF